MSLAFTARSKRPGAEDKQKIIKLPASVPVDDVKFFGIFWEKFDWLKNQALTLRITDPDSRIDLSIESASPLDAVGVEVGGCVVDVSRPAGCVSLWACAGRRFV
jgi:hypothetical protein